MRARDVSDGSRFTTASPHSGFVLLLRLLLEDDDVLPGQDVARLDVPQRVDRHLLEYLPLTHLMDKQDRHLGVYLARDAEREVTAAGADVRDDVSGPELERLHQFRRLLLPLALGTFQPAGPLMPHHLGNLAAHVELADTVGVVDAADLVALR